MQLDGRRPPRRRASRCCLPLPRGPTAPRQATTHAFPHCAPTAPRPAPPAREVWHHIVRPGTLRALIRATIQAACGRGWSFQWPASLTTGALLDPSVSGDLDAGAGGRSSEW